MMDVKIITPTGLYKQCVATQINARSVEGEFGLLSNHMPMVAMLTISKLTIIDKEGSQEYAISGGMLHFANNEVRILTDAIEGEAEIDLERAEKARIRAEKRLASHESEVNMRRAEIALQKAINRISVKSNQSM
ncbi:MAG: ATP synthase F1 subunit epsilon [Erysipelotrichia bacterium]|nr:ATP synthase F1 subunit epsilon [Erysipelotrichia bacterium]